MRPRKWLSTFVVSAVVAAPMILGATAAHAEIGLAAQPNFTSPTVPGQTAPAQLVISNSSVGPEAVGAVTVNDITLIPSCGSLTPGCPSPDPGVFQLNGPFTGTGSPGAVCPTSYTVSVIAAGTGEVRFTPVGAAPALDVGESCTISFSTTTLRVPSVDSQPGTPGIQTNALGKATGVAANGTAGGGSGSEVVTVNRAPSTMATQATPQQVNVGEGFSDLATVTGTPGGPTPTGTVTFQLFGPTSPGFPTCAGPPFATSAPRPLSATGPTTATAGSGTFGAGPTVPVGNYVFVATYSGDANFLGSTGACSDPAERVTVEPLPTITVDKTATPLSRPEPGGSFTFNVVVTNTSPETVTITSLVDNIYGNIANQGSCTTSVGTVLAANGGTYSCSFTGSFTGNAGDSQTDTVTATAVDSDGNPANDAGDATVTLTNVAPTVVVEKTASPLSRPAPGGTFTFSVAVTNTSNEPVTITSLTDDIYGNIANQGTCTTVVGTVLAASPGPGNTYSCSFTGSFTGAGGASQTDTVTVVVVDDDGSSATDTDDATVTITALPTITVEKTANPLSRPEPGGVFTFNVVVTNTGARTVTITSLTDNIYGNIATQGTCTTSVGTVLAPSGGTYSCAFNGSFNGNAGASQTDIVTANAVDSGGSTATDTDDATVTLTNVVPTVQVVNTVSPDNLAAPGGAFTFNVVITNTSFENVTITALTDDVYGNVAALGTCTTAIGRVLAPSGGVFSCSFSGNFFGNAGASQTDVVTVSVSDNDGSSATATDDATVYINPVLSITDVRVVEGNAGTTNAVFTVSLSGSHTRPVTVAFATANGSALAGTDYTPVGGTLRFAAGETSKVIVVPVAGDTTLEADETFVVNLSSPVNVGVPDAQATGTIVNDDGTGVGTGDTGTGSGTGGTGTGSGTGRPGSGYTMVASDGAVFAFGEARFFGSTGGIRLNRPVVGMARKSSNGGYWLAASDGGIFAFGDATFLGSLGSTKLNKPIVGIAATPSGGGYWMVASDGGVFAFGDATFFGSTGSLALNQPVVGMAATPTGKGYFLVASDGGIFAFGDAAFFGSTGSIRLNQPIVGMAADPDGKGYWLVAADGGVFAFEAQSSGSTGNLSLRSPVVGMAADPDGKGYWLAAADGGVYAFDASFLGSTSSLRLNGSIGGIAS